MRGRVEEWKHQRTRKRAHDPSCKSYSPASGTIPAAETASRSCGARSTLYHSTHLYSDM